MSALHPFDPYNVFQAAVVKYADRIALRIGEREWSYRELETQAAAIAGWCERNTPTRARIAVFGKKELAAYAGILGILRSGRSYVPLHPDHPPVRWRSVLEQSGSAACILPSNVGSDIAEELKIPILSDWSNEAHVPPILGQEAYVMFTSGSTGGPKGVPVPRNNVAAYLEHMLTRYSFIPEDRFSQLFALTFDLSVHDLFVCWGSGACLCVPEDDSALRMSAYVETNAITSWFSVPSLAALMRRMRSLRAGALPSLKHSFFCGEALSWDVANSWREAASNSTVVNLYGPTEATIAITEFELTSTDSQRSGTVPLGRAIGRNKAKCIPDTEPNEGELWLSGPQVTEGYLGRSEETANAFKQLPEGNELWYATGDRVRVDRDGIFHFIGRKDDQAKVLGHRVEPAEVDGLLAPVVSPANVLTLPFVKGDITRLVTFIDMELDTAPLMEHLRANLPAYMVPERIVCVGAFPTTAHGKLDRATLISMVVDEQC